MRLCSLNQSKLIEDRICAYNNNDKVCPSICQCRWYGPHKNNLNTNITKSTNSNRGFE